MSAESLLVERQAFRFTPDPRRVVLRPLVPPTLQRVTNVVQRVMRLPESAVRRLLAEVMAEFRGRHADLERTFERHCERARGQVPVDGSVSAARCLLLGSCFTAEYALESAALFNPSIVPHPVQGEVPAGWVRFIMSFRATGEGHVSSIEFRTGLVSDQNEIVVDPPGRFVTPPEIEPDPTYNKELFARKLREMDLDDPYTAEVLTPLPDPFTLAALKGRLEDTRPRERRVTRSQRRARETIVWLAESNYQVHFARDIPLAERIIFPVSDAESNGIEDARFVRFVDDDGSVTYYATYTAYNGRTILPNLLETTDFLTFDVRTLNGQAVQNKGMALFPRKVDGRYAMISRQDNENLFIMFSEHPHFWNDAEPLLSPRYPWEFMQMGNCGSPIETDAGWLLLTHGVGPMRKYCIGAILLDLKDPRRVIGRLAEPLLSPNENEREGYVPNVVYTCGAMLHNRRLIIPYAMSDTASSIATVSLDALLERLKPPGRARRPAGSRPPSARR